MKTNNRKVLLQKAINSISHICEITNTHFVISDESIQFYVKNEYQDSLAKQISEWADSNKYRFNAKTIRINSTMYTEYTLQ